MATFSIGFTSSKVFVMLSVAMCIMLATGVPLVHIRSTDRNASNTTSDCESGKEMKDELVNIVSYTKHSQTWYYINALLVHSGNSIIGACLELYRTFLTV